MKFYHHWFQSDQAVLGLIDELGARDRVLFPRPVTAIYYHDQFHPSIRCSPTCRCFCCATSR